MSIWWIRPYIRRSVSDGYLKKRSLRLNTTTPAGADDDDDDAEAGR